MKKIFSFILAFILIISSTGCSNVDKLSGSFSERDEEGYTGYRYEFVINDSGRGDYGGELKIYNDDYELESTAAWYIEDELVYINGNGRYIYRNGHLYGDEPVDGITVYDDGSISGNNKQADEGSVKALIFTDDLSLVQTFESDIVENEKNHYYVYWANLYGMEGGMYVVEGDVVSLYDEGDANDLSPYYFYILDNTLRKSKLDPV